MDIIVRKNATHRMFRPHMNHALGKYYHTKEDYLKDMKAGGFEPYDPKSVPQPKREGYKPSKWAHDMIDSVQYDKKGKPIIGDRFKEEILDKNNMKPVPDGLIGKTKLNNMEGGWLDA